MSGEKAPGHPAAAYVLLTDTNDRVLAVRGNWTGHWHLPGGIIEANESPISAVVRETHEELGLTIDVQEHDMFAVEWVQPRTPTRRPRFVFVFAGPRLTPTDTSRISLQRTELGAWSWMTRQELSALMHPAVARRIVGPLQTPGGAVYREARHERTL
ncbi:NUDIX domain-containing protein [Streptomyces chattanoogensis]